jgi:hypothetical protein
MMEETNRLEKRIRIVSDGSFSHTRVFDDEGREITQLVKRVEWSHGVGELPTAILHFISAEFEGRMELVNVTSLKDRCERFTLARPDQSDERKAED